MIQFRFDPRKALEVLLYIIKHIDKKERYHILKVLYFADREHLRRYGRFINGDTYYALDHGPVPDQTYNLIKEMDHIKQSWYCFPEEIKTACQKAFECKGDMVVALREPELDYLSESDRECLDLAIKEFGSLSFSELKTRSHDKAYKSVGPLNFIPVENIISTESNADELLEYIIQDY
jgi:uncharacterized phage-associated protein